MSVEARFGAPVRDSKSNKNTLFWLRLEFDRNAHKFPSKSAFPRPFLVHVLNAKRRRNSRFLEAVHNFFRSHQHFSPNVNSVKIDFEYIE